MSYKEQKELETLPDTIAHLEKEEAELAQTLADGTLYRNSPARRGQAPQSAASRTDPPTGTGVSALGSTAAETPQGTMTCQSVRFYYIFDR
ncbi:hypothetical protein CARN8_4980001 [mine drainage metagenome]|uniref:ABC transporter Uup C-terminal domain-containing protein n=1 Tax=mine drainage metagenome TaxID=410659 RepID=A0A3P3ZQR3_9ZZZZ